MALYRSGCGGRGWWGHLEKWRSHNKPNAYGRRAVRKGLKRCDRQYTRKALKEYEGRR